LAYDSPKQENITSQFPLTHFSHLYPTEMGNILLTILLLLLHYICLTALFQDTWVSWHHKRKQFWILLE